MESLRNNIFNAGVQVAAALGFAVLCVLIVIFGAKPGLVRHKLKLGSVLVLLSSMLGGCFSDESGGLVRCYGAPAMSDTADGGQRDGGAVADTAESDTDDIPL